MELTPNHSIIKLIKKDLPTATAPVTMIETILKCSQKRKIQDEPSKTTLSLIMKEKLF